ncbi:complex I 24 kDa subunit family protein [Longimicrobium terrae]|uniref:NADH:ubiquinone oxidoreductase subunit E n=1 Tax=Longimicrobium terrae TaxID=1639882 RepID=A0A841H014_9BACT|nr:NAD(P)H-dependent oxidoreductase subunit E [Longimicrobium terrae]MBB4637039.1 NADH:ubiquinone oxidoreductase subunit E [Longimicrobium terrae]MBB6071353.1 NADH:ubiquinone oxidoreductase subunit E [Longimicrobium terrae]NNC31428.1 NAD(P)H-dependent oxidoreductase subunit E [Longimicrobium terrae]
MSAEPIRSGSEYDPTSWPEAKQVPGFAGDTGEFATLSEADVRGSAYVGQRPADGGHASVAGTLPYQVATSRADAPLFVGPYEDRLEKVLSRYPDRQAALLPALHLAHELRGHLSPQTQDEVAERLQLPPAYVRGVATFYTMYNLAPVGKYLIQVCTNISCNLCGGDAVLESFLKHTGTDLGEVSANGLWTVIEVECLGACGFPTAVQINERYFENVRPENVPAILERLV